jgi:hypothetical protein
MTLNEYIRELNDLAGLNPEVGNMPVVYSKDSEGNGFYAVDSLPCVMKFENEGSYCLEPVEDDEDGFEAVCVN